MYFRKTYFKLDHYFLARPKPIQRCCPYIVHRIPCHRNLIRIISDSSSYMAVPIRATIFSALTLIPFLTLVPISSMIFSASMRTTSFIFMILGQVLNIFRFPLTLMATFSEVSSIKKRAQLRSKADRQQAERLNAFRTRMQNQQQTIETVCWSCWYQRPSKMKIKLTGRWWKKQKHFRPILNWNSIPYPFFDLLLFVT